MPIICNHNSSNVLIIRYVLSVIVMLYVFLYTERVNCLFSEAELFLSACYFKKTQHSPAAFVQSEHSSGPFLCNVTLLSSAQKHKNNLSYHNSSHSSSRLHPCSNMCLALPVRPYNISGFSTCSLAPRQATTLAAKQ